MQGNSCNCFVSPPTFCLDAEIAPLFEKRLLLLETEEIANAPETWPCHKISLEQMSAASSHGECGWNSCQEVSCWSVGSLVAEPQGRSGRWLSTEDRTPEKTENSKHDYPRHENTWCRATSSEFKVRAEAAFHFARILSHLLGIDMLPLLSCTPPTSSCQRDPR